MVPKPNSEAAKIETTIAMKILLSPAKVESMVLEAL